MTTIDCFSSLRHNSSRVALCFLVLFVWAATLPALESREMSAAAAWAAAPQDELASARRRMVERDISGRGVRDPRVLEVMGVLPRHLFVPENLRPLAYEDRPLPIGAGQTISQPYVVALMTQLLELEGTERVLEIGTGSGYQTAVLAGLAREVFSVEIIEMLTARAQQILERLGMDNIRLKVGDGFHGWEVHAPFDAILVTAAAREIPDPLWRQLREGGVLVMPLGKAGHSQRLIRARKIGGRRVIEDLDAVLFVPLTGETQKRSR